MKEYLPIIFIIIINTLFLNVNSQTTRNVCEGLNEGYFVNSDVNCHAFYRCTNGQPVFGECDKDHYFNEPKQLCDYPENVDCPSDTFTCPPTGIAIFPVADSCADYIICANGIAEHRSCVDGFLFDIEHKICDFAEFVDCNREVCNDVDDPNELAFFPSMDNCYDYFICLNGEATHKSCRNGGHFNAVRNSCDSPANANCHLLTTTTPPPTFDCPNPTGVQTYPATHSCSEFWRCVNGQETLITCLDGFHFDVNYGQCNHASAVNCQL